MMCLRNQTQANVKLTNRQRVSIFACQTNILFRLQLTLLNTFITLWMHISAQTQNAQHIRK